MVQFSFILKDYGWAKGAVGTFSCRAVSQAALLGDIYVLYTVLCSQARPVAGHSTAEAISLRLGTAPTLTFLLWTCPY